MEKGGVRFVLNQGEVFADKEKLVQNSEYFAKTLCGSDSYREVKIHLPD